jgi:RNA recognition motif-containing protein
LKLFVGNLPYEITTADLLEFFGQIGRVSAARVITDRETSRSKGFGFVEMNDGAAAQAIQEFNGTEAMGRTLVVSIARERSRTDDPGSIRE